MVGGVCLFLLVWYSMGGAYLMRTMASTPMLLIFASHGDAELGVTLTIERVVFTFTGVAVAAAVAVVLQRLAARRSTAG